MGTKGADVTEVRNTGVEVERGYYHGVPTSWQDEALAHDGVSREVPSSALKGETVVR